MLILTPAERRALRARAHALDPVVMIGHQGLTPAVLREIDRALDAHELIKVRIFNDERDEREALQLTICRELTCAPVQHLGKLIVLWRPAPPPEKPAVRPAKGKATKTARKSAFSAKAPGAIDRRGQAVKPLSARQARRWTDESRASETVDMAETAGRPPRRSRSSAGTMLPKTAPRPPRKSTGAFTTAKSAVVGGKTRKTSGFPATARPPAARPSSRRRFKNT